MAVEKGQENIRQKAVQHLWKLGTSRKKVLESGGPIIFERGEGCYLYDDQGKKYLDGLSGVWVVNSGHGQPEIIDKIVEQYSTLSYGYTGEGYGNRPEVELAEKLTSILPGDMSRVYFTCGGSESVEIALRFSRLFHRINGRNQKYKIIARERSYHGATLFSFAVSGYDMISQSIGPLPEGIIKTRQPYCYRCEHSPENCNCVCADHLEEVILENGPETISAFIAEPISASSGVAVPPQEYWKKIREICDQYDVLLIADEVLTGFGRTGQLFGIENFGVQPDIMTLSKGLTSGYAPLGAVATNKRLSSEIPVNAFLPQGFTYSGHPISCAAALANIDFILKNNLAHNAEKMGEYLKSSLIERLEGNPFIGEIRGKGLLLCIELHPKRCDSKISKLLLNYFLKQGLYTRVVKEYIHLGPPLTITKEEVDQIIEIVSSGFEKLAKKLK